MLTSKDFQIKKLGTCDIVSPACNDCEKNVSCDGKCGVGNCVDDSARVFFENRIDRVLAEGVTGVAELPSCELFGPRHKIFFDPACVRAGIVTCGGLCPGLNDVIRAVVMELYYRYGVSNILGFRYGYEGMISRSGHAPMVLTPDLVDHIHETGGTILSSSRGTQDYGEMVDFLVEHGVNMLFTLGGDGTQKGAAGIGKVIEQRGEKISVIGIPKTIDNDILYLDKSFGFETACTVAVKVVQCAHIEAQGAKNGIGLVKLMGRESGFIAANTALASGNANAVLIPEVPFRLDGKNGLLAFLKNRLATRRHACIIVAEGAGQDLMDNANLGTDASGNAKYQDIGLFLKQKIGEYLKAEGVDHTVKYIDPSYEIRSVPASAEDSLYCLRLGQGAVHAAMSGRTEMVVGQVNGQIVHLPIGLVTSGRKRVNPQGSLWRSVIEATGQPKFV